VVGLRWQSAVDFVVLTVAIAVVLRWSSETRALRLALSILALRIAAVLTDQLGLLISTWVLDALTLIALLVLVVAFQPELRRAVMRLDLPGRAAHERQLPTLVALATAAFSLARIRCGALIVILQEDSIDELITGGVVITARVSSELLQAMFQKQSPLHDGAVVVDGDQITHAGAILPLTQRGVPDEYGTRHRAGLGLSERSDAQVIVVSEERGEVTIMRNGSAQVMRDLDGLVATLRTTASTESNRSQRRRVRVRLTAGVTTLSLLLSALVWSATFLLPGRSVRIQTAPVELTNVPVGLTVDAQSVQAVQVWLRATDFVFGSVNLADLVARCDLGRAHSGVNVIPLNACFLGVPLGIKVDRLAPRELRVTLADTERGRR
jgi:diadenylate cyclase